MFKPTYTRATATARVPHVLGAVEVGEVVLTEYVRCGVIRVHVPELGVQFTTSPDNFTTEEI